MTDKNHPCYGLVCQDCIQCKFDVDLFKDGVLPNEKKTSNITQHNKMKPICNYCGYLVKSYNGEERRFFNACCSKKTVMYNEGERPMVIDFSTYEMADIERPDWCPLHPMESSISHQLALPNKNEISETSEREDKPKAFKDMTYTEKREELKKLPKRLNWDDIKEGGYYLIPKIMSAPRKIVHVELKTDSCLRCHEVSEYSGTEYGYVTNVYPNDIEAVMIVELHNY